MNNNPHKVQLCHSKLSGKKKLIIDDEVIIENKTKKLFNNYFQIESYEFNLVEKADSKYDIIVNEESFDYILEKANNSKTSYQLKYSLKELNNLFIKFINNLEIQDFFYNIDSVDHVFNLLKKKEKEELLKFFNSKKSEFNGFLSKFNYNINNNFDNFISTIINYENATKVYTNKLKREISKISNNANQFEVKYLSVMLVGKSGVGKSTLINSILKSKKCVTGNGKFQTVNINSYQSDNIPFLRLIDTRGIELSQQYGPENVKRDTEKYINVQYSLNDTNNFVHCIWYCITGTRFEQAEIDLLNSLRKSYGDNTIPIIIIYTQATDDVSVNEMQNYIKQLKINVNFIKILSERKKLVNNNYLEAFGLDELITLTLEKCKKAMRGEMRSVMTKNITKYLENRIFEENNNIKEYIYENAILDFISNYKYVKKDEEFIDYIISLFGINVFYFLEKEMGSKSYNYFKNESIIINNAHNYINSYKDYILKMIENPVTKFSIDFIDYQVKFQKKQNKEIELNNKRCIQDFKDTSTKFLCDNYYYIAQTHYINHHVLQSIIYKLSISFINNLNQLTKNLLSDNEIQKLVTECFLKKYSEFEKRCYKFFDNFQKNSNKQNFQSGFNQINDNNFNLNNNTFNQMPSNSKNNQLNNDFSQDHKNMNYIHENNNYNNNYINLNGNNNNPQNLNFNYNVNNINFNYPNFGKDNNEQIDLPTKSQIFKKF